jgi:hypothetical protein
MNCLLQRWLIWTSDDDLPITTARDCLYRSLARVGPIADEIDDLVYDALRVGMKYSLTGIARMDHADHDTCCPDRI